MATTSSSSGATTSTSSTTSSSTGAGGAGGAGGGSTGTVAPRCEKGLCDTSNDGALCAVHLPGGLAHGDAALVLGIVIGVVGVFSSRRRRVRRH